MLPLLKSYNKIKALGFTQLRVLPLLLITASNFACEADSGVGKLPKNTTQDLKVVSLSPALTSTAEFLGAEKNLVGTSDFYQGKLQLPKLGSSLTPNFEAILRASPSLIVMTQVQGDQSRQLAELAPTRQYPWLTVKEIASSIELFGQALGRPQRAANLAARFRDELQKQVAKEAPSIYLTWESQDGSSGRYFVKRNSAHGAILRAAGGKNAVDRDVEGYPQLSTEQLIRLNPFAIIVLRDGEPNAQKEGLALRELRKLKELKAVKTGKIRTLSAPGILNMGPSLLNWIQPMKTMILELREKPEESVVEPRAAETQ